MNNEPHGRPRMDNGFDLSMPIHYALFILHYSLIE